MNETTKRHLRETVAWCLHTMSPDDLGPTTRTPEVCPDLLAGQDEFAQLDAIHKSTGTLGPAVEQICERRGKLVRKLGLKLPMLEYCEVMGRIFCTDFNTDQCEAATDISNGFFDLADIPGWDTWFAYEPTDTIQGHIYGWVPNEITELVGLGMWAIPVSCVWWVGSIPETAG